MPFDLAQRRLEPEWMDQPDLDPARHRHALCGLERINRLSRSLSILWAPLLDFARGRPGARLTLLDVATGAGDLPIGLARAARHRGLNLAVHACDISPVAVAHASQRARDRHADVRFYRHDILAAPLPGAFDIVTCSLFLHHLDGEQAVLVLNRLRTATGALLLINDLDRTTRGWMLAWAGTRLLSRSPIVHDDGPRSVAAAWTPAEVRDLARHAGLDRVALTRHWPCRWRLLWRPT